MYLQKYALQADIIGFLLWCLILLFFASEFFLIH